MAGLDDHPGHPRVDRQLGELPAHAGQPGAVEGAELLQQQPPVAYGPGVGRLDERERRDLAELERGHLEQHRGERRTQDLGVGELRPGLEVLARVQPDADAAGALGRGCLRDRLDRQPLHLRTCRPAGDARGAGVDDGADAGHGERRLGDVGGEHDPAAGMWREHGVLLGRGQPPVERHHLIGARTAEHLGGVADLAFAGEEHQHVAGPLAGELLAGAPYAVDLVVVLRERAVAHLDRVGAAADGQHRRVVKVPREPLRVDRRGGDHDLEVGAPGQQPLEVAEQEVDVQRPLVRFVDHDRVVGEEVGVAAELGERDAVGHHLDQRRRADLVVEADRVADQPTERRAQLLGDPLGDRAGRDPARLGVADHPVDAAPQAEQDLRQLGGLAGPGLAGEDDDLVVADRGRDLVAGGRDRQVRRKGELRYRSPAYVGVAHRADRAVREDAIRADGPRDQRRRVGTPGCGGASGRATGGAQRGLRPRRLRACRCGGDGA